ncbi:MAG TPA: sensor domain-containing protein [Actinomycetes bacterium]|nr:sensor domain-containing protein [Actinomycetes bacterium]
MDSLTADHRVHRLVAPLVDPATYRAWTFFVAALPLGTVGFSWALVALGLGVASSFTLLGIPIVAVSVVGARWIARLARPLARWGLGAKLAEPAPLVHEPGLLGWMKAALTDSVGWRGLLYLVLMFPVGLVLSVLALTIAATAVLTPVLLVAPWVIRWIAVPMRWLAERLLAPLTLSERAARLRAGRQQVVDTAAGERRRIERDLHDGAQARLVALAMDLGMAKEKLATGRDPEHVEALVTTAHDEVKLALQELRELARGIHPAVLTDLGLDAALSAVAARCTVPVTMNVSVPVRPAPGIEQIAYFCVSELLVNVSRHSSASAASVDVLRTDGVLTIAVRDDGIGGARVWSGTGLSGLAERVEAVDGRFLVDSPMGGPTLVTVELPCGS